MRYILAILLVLGGLLIAHTSLAQDSERGFLQGSLEDALSGPGRTVRVTGFEGALSSVASIEEMTVADETGVWLTLREVELDWTRSALLRGRLEVNKLTAKEILVPRLPVPVETPMAPEATPFSLPELPVSIDVGEISSERIVLGEPLFGQEAALSLTGSMQLENGSGEAKLLATRVDGATGMFDLDAAYRNADRQLRIALVLDEGADGIAATLMGLPGTPPVSLELRGDAPLSDFRAELALATDGQDRLTGVIALSEVRADETIEAPADRVFSADFSGDITPLFEPEFRDFFGSDAGLMVQGTLVADGSVTVDQFELKAREVSLRGSLALAAGGLPRKIDVTGRIAAAGGPSVLLPLSGQSTRVRAVDLAIAFDAEAGEAWTGGVVIDGLDRPDFKAEVLRLNGSGRIGRLSDDGRAFVTSTFDFTARNLDLGSDAAEAALGETVTGSAAIGWEAGAPVTIERLDVAGETYSANASGTLGLGGDLRFDGAVSASVLDLQAFSGLAGRQLSGAADATIAGKVALLSGQFDLTAQANTLDLAVGIAEVDTLLAGAGNMTVLAARGPDGLAVKALRVATPAALISGRGVLRSEGSEGRIDVALSDAGDLLAGLTGPVTLMARTSQAQDIWDVSLQAVGEALGLDVAGRIETGGDVPVFDGDIAANAKTLAPFAALAGRDIAGGFAAETSGRISIDLREIQMTAALDGDGLRIGQPQADTVLAGASRLEARIGRSGSQIDIDDAIFTSPALRATGAARLGHARNELRVSAQLANLAIFVPELPGAASASGTAVQVDGGDWQVDVSATGPGGATVSVAGAVAPDFGRTNIALNGRAPLALANPLLAPRQVSGVATFDLRLDGAPSLGAVSGQVRTTGARFVAPELGIVLDNINAVADLAAAQATVDMTAAVQGGGRIAVAGPVGLVAPNTADLNVTLTNVKLTDPTLYETSVSGRLTVVGPLAGGARIGGRLGLGPTELRIPSATAVSTSPIPQLRHVNEPAAIRQTRARAGLIESAKPGGGGPVYPLDLVIRSENQMFIRGRGLDAELGGQLRLGGTTADIRPDGQFELVRGRLDILGKRLVLTEGLVRLQGSFDPFLRLEATTQAEDVTVRIVIEGQASNPTIRFLSDPELPEEEVVAQLLFGRGIETLSALQAAQLASAVATLAGRGGDGILSRLRESTGLDDLDVTSAEDGTTAVRAGKYISDKVYTDVTVGSDGTSEINLNLDLSPRVTVKGSVDTTGNTGIGLFFQRDY